MLTLGVVIVGIGSASILAAIGMEIWKKEPIYQILMKVSALIITIGSVLVGKNL